MTEVDAPPPAGRNQAGTAGALEPGSAGRRRLRSETVDLKIRIGDGCHDLAVSLAVDENYSLHEIAFVGRGKIGHGLDEMLRELGIQLSRAIQGRDPETGAPPP